MTTELARGVLTATRMARAHASITASTLSCAAVRIALLAENVSTRFDTHHRGAASETSMRSRCARDRLGFGVDGFEGVDAGDVHGAQRSLTGAEDEFRERQVETLTQPTIERRARARARARARHFRRVRVRGHQDGDERRVRLRRELRTGLLERVAHRADDVDKLGRGADGERSRRFGAVPRACRAHQRIDGDR